MKKLLTIIFAVALGLNLSAQDDCQPSPDLNEDGVVGMSDLLTLLSYFGDFDLDSDGIWDSVDDCVGEYDECGVCNGGGIPEEYTSCDEFYGACGGATFQNYHGFDYNIVQIGEQCWFADNLRSLSYANNVPIEDENVFSCSEDSPESTDTGFLYTWWAVDSPNGLCPTGWHVSSYEDWIDLQVFVDNPTGTPLKNSEEDVPSWNGTNLYGFSAFPQGRRQFSDDACETTSYAWFWTSSAGNGGVKRSVFFNFFPSFVHEINTPSNGHNIRCLKDAE